MLIRLSDTNSQGLELELTQPGADDEDRQLVKLLETKGLAGELFQAEGVLRLTGGRAERIAIDAMRLIFGTVVLGSGGTTLLSQLATRVEQAAGALELDLAIGSLKSPRLQVSVGQIVVAAHAELEGVELSVRGNSGRITAGTCRFGGLSVDLGGVKLAAPQLQADGLVIAWGDGFELSARQVHTNTLDFTTLGVTARAEQVRAKRLEVRDADWSLQGLTAADARVDADLVRAPTEVPAAPVQAEESSSADRPEYQAELPVFDWALLDKISGRFAVDVGVDLSLPVIQRRRAVHKLRLDIEDGTLDFRELESNLAALEDMLLDFSVRETDLVLELGVPLLPTRGHGKPLVRWPLTPAERALAQNDRVRLARLARPAREVPAEDEADVDTDNGSGKSRKGLEELRLENIDAQLVVKPHEQAMESLLRSFAARDISIKGEVVHRVSNGASSDEAERTSLEAALAGIQLELDDFPLTGRRFDLKEFCIGEVESLRLELLNAAPQRLTLQLSDVSSRSVDFGSFAED